MPYLLIQFNRLEVSIKSCLSRPAESIRTGRDRGLHPAHRLSSRGVRKGLLKFYLWNQFMKLCSAPSAKTSANSAVKIRKSHVGNPARLPTSDLRPPTSDFTASWCWVRPLLPLSFPSGSNFYPIRKKVAMAFRILMKALDGSDLEEVKVLGGYKSGTGSIGIVSFE